MFTKYRTILIFKKGSTCTSTLVPRPSHFLVWLFTVCKKWKRKPGLFYHVNDVSVYPWLTEGEMSLRVKECISHTHSFCPEQENATFSRLVPKPSPAPVFDRLQYAKHCKRSKTGAREGLGTRLTFSTSKLECLNRNYKEKASSSFFQWGTPPTLRLPR